ncbi:MAG: hypothetical protein QOH09_849 [Pseudonocardiales bacterium]|nr:hypothetical protein [Pseudonocardiales bacterium]
MRDVHPAIAEQDTTRRAAAPQRRAGTPCGLEDAVGGSGASVDRGDE